MIGEGIKDAVNRHIFDYDSSLLKTLVGYYGDYVIKFVSSKWANEYLAAKSLKISNTPALTWGTATYVTPLAFPLSSALYGRIGLVCKYDPVDWRIFEATSSAAQMAYIRWAQAQPAYQVLLLTVHSTHANHKMRNKFREDFEIDCVLFHPDQEAEQHTDISNHVWMAVTDWSSSGRIDPDFSTRFSQARFSVLIDEDFQLQDKGGLPVGKACRQIESATEVMHRRKPLSPLGVTSARHHPGLPIDIATAYNSGGYVHVFIEP